MFFVFYGYMNPIPFSIPFEFDGKRYVCEINPLKKQHPSPRTFQIVLNQVYFGIITFTGQSWESDSRKRQLVEKIGSLIHESYPPFGS